MPNITFKIRRSPELIQSRVLSKEWYDGATKAWNQAIETFIIAVASEVAQHQDTGMSLASLFATARKVKAGEKLPPIEPRVDYRQGLTYISGVYNPNRIRNASVGQRFGEKSSTIGYGTPKVPIFRFSFQIQVFQYFLHEFGYTDKGGKRHPAWSSLVTGRAAMMEYIRTFGKDFFPNLGKLFNLSGGKITTTRIS